MLDHGRDPPLLLLCVENRSLARLTIRNAVPEAIDRLPERSDKESRLALRQSEMEETPEAEPTTSGQPTIREREPGRHGSSNPVSGSEPGACLESDLFYTSHGISFVSCSARIVPTMKILLKRAYEEPDNADGFCILVDRLWPGGKKKADLRLDMWTKDISQHRTEEVVQAGSGALARVL